MPPDDNLSSCGADELQYLVGRPGVVLDGMRFSQDVRVIQYGMAVTMDYSPYRLNIWLDRRDVIERVTAAETAKAPEPCDRGLCDQLTSAEDQAYCFIARRSVWQSLQAPPRRPCQRRWFGRGDVHRGGCVIGQFLGIAQEFIPVRPDLGLGFRGRVGSALVLEGRLDHSPRLDQCRLCQLRRRRRRRQPCHRPCRRGCRCSCRWSRIRSDGPLRSGRCGRPRRRRPLQSGWHRSLRL